LLKEVVKMRHEFSKQECEHQHYISGLRYRMEKETQSALNCAEAERFHFEFEIKALEDELDARARIFRGEEERMVVRRDCYAKELETLQHNLDKSDTLVIQAREQMASELRTRQHDGHRMLDDIKANYEKRLASMREDYEKSKKTLQGQINDKDKELDGEFKS
jgi:hypothetical protein